MAQPILMWCCWCRYGLRPSLLVAGLLLDSDMALADFVGVLGAFSGLRKRFVFMKRKFNSLLNLILVGGLLFFLFQKAPVIIGQFEAEGDFAPAIVLPLVGGNVFDSRTRTGPLVVVFWATWCGPCELELSRVNKMVLNKEINPSSVLAISVQEERQLVARAVRERNYQFEVGLDSDGQIAELYKVRGTPTVVLVDEHRRIQWMTTGLSPSLEYRINDLLKDDISK